VYKRPEDGIVLIDEDRCRGYRECVKGCPYKKTFFNPMSRVSEKCIGCYPAIENGRQTQCTITCIGKIRLQGFINPPDKAREDSPIDYLVHVARIAKPLYPQFGLEPNVYYIPPVHVPPAYLQQMFGAGVTEATAAYRKAPDNETLLGALMLFGAVPDIIDSFNVANGQAIGFDAKGVWKDGVWRVIIAYPLGTGSDNDPRLLPGGSSLAAFAVWDGGAREVGARKAWASWVPLKLAQ